MEILYWLQDVREHLRVSRRRRALRRPGAGVDYTADKYQHITGRTVSRIHPEQMRLSVTEIVQETPTTKTLRCERLDGPLPPFRPGQYVNVFVDVDGVLTSRPYSIATPRAEHNIELTVRDKPGGFVSPFLLNEIQVGDELITTGPEGSFYHEPLIDGDDLVFLAGGSGVTPFMSIIRDALRRGSPLNIHLLYGSRVPDDVIFGAELAELAATGQKFRYALVISEPPPDSAGNAGGRPYLNGFLDAGVIREQVGDVTGKTFYICGPDIMYDFCLVELAKLGVPMHKVRRELYGPPEDVTKEPGWPVDLAPDTIFEVQILDQQTIRAPAGEPLMNSLERYGIVVPAICRSGACSACRVRLLSGRVFMPDHAGLRESDREHGYIHACVSYPLADLQIRL